MPSYPYLFEKRKVNGKTSADALRFPTHFAVEPGYEVIPKQAARQLVAYLRSLKSETPLLELPSLTPSTNVVAETNAPAATDTNPPSATNPPAK
jgi:hypothetical protein